METIFLEIQAHIANQMPELSLIDEDYGQLEAVEDGYPVTFPCVLISNVETSWSNQGANVQKGTAEIAVRLAIDCYHDTHYTSGTAHYVQQRLAMNQKLYLALQGFMKGRREVSPLVRTQSRNYSLPRAIKIYETTFQFDVHDNSAFVNN